ncbi:MAG: ATP-binding cassette domain-containing protein [Candidatus Latescibacteria bacterium]|nr:ATP-binding cassette domain-containing protein [Candidatus Latescibacterota bacterium]NIM66327.1 ATP-binding cassette domain-containing protein [Candidatus Latescibacterota bacterium]NIO02806.1 ATP-binding cassette domain-containing protein [Candidatus Latescibacterota bacterium]NIO29941.1 ATP-binding cassette domain-containing protein [Candidatus Latescibacterota bacterium]NIO57556.1 ATP-binding cassette domain-containing protein [Candidatus Latescibacterota bacterium]
MTLVLESIQKRMGSFTLPNLDLEVKEGEYLVLVGPSGVGKTVLLEIIAGLLNPDSGNIFWRNRNVTSCAPERRGFGIMYQDYALFPHLTVFQNIVYGLNSRGLPRIDVKERAISAAEMVNIVPFLERLPDELSGGEKQRVALARALVVAPELLLLDEPLSAVDMHLRRRLQRELKRIQEQTGTTFVHVTHNVDEALTLGHRIGVMLDGHLRQIGPPEEIFRKPTDREVARFLGMRNIFAVRVGGQGFCEANGVKIHVGERPVPYRHIWIRPEEIILSREAFESSARNQFRCVVEDWDYQDILVRVVVALENLRLSVMITYKSFDKLGIDRGVELMATFKSSAVHCF